MLILKLNLRRKTMKSLFLSLMTITFAMGASAQASNEETAQEMKTLFTCRDKGSNEVVEDFDFAGYLNRNCMSALTDSMYNKVSRTYYLDQQSMNGCLYVYRDPTGQNKPSIIECSRQ
jgi:hypothetical protein